MEDVDGGLVGFSRSASACPAASAMGLLGQPVTGRMGGDAEDVDLAGGVFNDEERVEPGRDEGVKGGTGRRPGPTVAGQPADERSDQCPVGQDIRGRGVRFRTATWWRSRRLSTSLSAVDRASRTIQPTSWVTIK